MSTPAIFPPVNVEATQASASAPVEVSWSPPSDGPATITAYRIFYGNGENLSVLSIVTSIMLSLNEDSVGQTVSLRSETDQLTSQLINVTVTGQLESHILFNEHDYSYDNYLLLQKMDKILILSFLMPVLQKLV